MIKLALTSDLHYGFTENTTDILNKFFKQFKKDYKAQGCDALILGGDLATSKQSEFKSILKMVRRYFPTEPVLLVRGNHDFWDADKNYPIFHEMTMAHQKLFNELNIIHLDKQQVVIKDVVITGFDGWYYSINPPTRDQTYMHKTAHGAPVHSYLENKSFKDISAVLDLDLSEYRKKLCVTHFPSFTENERYLKLCANPKYHVLLTDKFDALLVGHSHQFVDKIEGNCRILNCGSDYDKPKYLIFEI